jgi:hypothetical protein
MLQLDQEFVVPLENSNCNVILSMIDTCPTNTGLSFTAVCLQSTVNYTTLIIIDKKVYPNYDLL